MLSAIPQVILDQLKQSLKTDITGFTFLAGGCINNGGRLRTAKGDFFLKWNDASRYPDMFETEAKGLKLLSQSDSICVPEVIQSGQAGTYQFLLLEYVNQGSKRDDYWDKLGVQLAALHRNTSMAFGLDHDNYIGSLRQSNRWHNSWADFFINERLQVQLKVAVDSALIDAPTMKKFHILFGILPSLMPEESPALLHGDLWNGNLMTNREGLPCLIDPAVYYGHREADLAMTQLFGGFNRKFLNRYHEVFPLVPGYLDRFDLYNLYPLLVHVNIFGTGYLQQVVSILRLYV